MRFKKVLFTIVIIFSLTIFTFLMIASTSNIGLKTSTTPNKKSPDIIIDAGHGGEDGGAVVGDVLEKTINLSISHDTADLLNFFGFNVSMTRTTDDAMTNEGESVKKRKYNDMKMRLDMYNSSDNNLIISIHQNKFSSSSSKGTQVFYSPNNEKSLVLADSIKYSVKSLLQPENERESKAADSGIYLLKNTKQPAVIVECGFISNAEECQLLLQEDYQKQMSFAITTGFIDYFNTN